MRIKALFVPVLLALFVTSASAESLATRPDDRMKEGWWGKRHGAALAAPNRATAKVVFIGDSITHGWEGSGKATWKHYYEGRGALNLGYSGDRTENVLWRFEHGELDGLSPKVAVLMIGTNNTGHRKDKPEEIADGVRAILDGLEKRLPMTKVLVLAIFPRAATSADAPRVNNDKANELVAKFADNKKVFFLDINGKFLNPDGILSKDVMPDLLHPQAKGYGIWAEAMEPTLAKLLGDEAVQPEPMAAQPDKPAAKHGKKDK